MGDTMRMKKISIIVIVALLLVVSLIFAFGYFEEQNFYNGIKKISDLENSTDVELDVIRQKAYPSNDEMREFSTKSINTTSEEILMLQDLKNQVFKKEYAEYIDIQLNRLNSENRTYTVMLNISDVYAKYKNGEMGYSEALSLINQKTKDMAGHSERVGEYKAESDTFLSSHSDMKDKFNELGIDEDFMFNQTEETKTVSVT